MTSTFWRSTPEGPSVKATTKKRAKKITATCAHCGKTFYTFTRRPIAICSAKCRAERNYQQRRRRRLDIGRVGEEQKDYLDWMPTPREILERRIEVHQMGTADGPEADRQAIVMIRRQLSALDSVPPRDPAELMLIDLHLDDGVRIPLEQAGIKTVAELVQRSQVELLKIPQIGETALSRIMTALRKEYARHAQAMQRKEQQDAKDQNPQGARH